MHAPKRLILLRHAKSAWDVPDADHGRPLNPRGRKDAPRVARALVEKGWRPDLVLSSDARRALETWELLGPELGGRPQVSVLDHLYLAGPHELTKLVAGVDTAVRTVLALGHNPGWEDCVAYFSGQATTMKTSSAALLEARRDRWPELAEPSSWRLVEVVRAKELRA